MEELVTVYDNVTTVENLLVVVRYKVFDSKKFTTIDREFVKFWGMWVFPWLVTTTEGNWYDWTESWSRSKPGVNQKIIQAMPHQS